MVETGLLVGRNDFKVEDLEFEINPASDGAYCSHRLQDNTKGITVFRGTATECKDFLDLEG
jgi:hypothetical protein